MSERVLPDEAAAWLRSPPVRDVEMIFPDMTGVPRGKTLPAAAFLAGQRLAIARAVAIQSYTGDFPDYRFYGEHDPDVTLEPDLSTLRPVPWAKTPRALVLCDCVDHDGGYSPIAPRSALRRVLEGYARLGLQPVVAPELEFYLFRPSANPDAPFQPPELRGGRVETGQEAFALGALNELEDFFDDLYRACEVLGIGTDTYVHEMGVSQFEINLKHGEALALADQTFLFKYVLKETALRHGLTAVCMAKPLAGAPGSSMHLHQSVVDANGQNVFSDADGTPTALFHHYIGGLQTHLGALMPLFCPSPNSYRRFTKGLAAPVNLSWGVDNRSVGLRIPVAPPAARRVENRLPGCDANPYLALAASLGAGLLGIQDQTAPSEPVQGNVFREESPCDMLPCSMEAALEAMQGSHAPARLFGEAFTAALLALRELELGCFREEITPWERRYLRNTA